MPISEKVIKLDKLRNKTEEAYIRERDDEKAKNLLVEIINTLKEIRLCLLEASLEEEYFDKNR